MYVSETHATPSFRFTRAPAGAAKGTAEIG